MKNKEILERAIEVLEDEFGDCDGEESECYACKSHHALKFLREALTLIE